MVRTIKKAEERRSEIIEVACDIFLKKGYEKTTMQEIIDGVGIAKGTIYHHFPSKDQLLDGVLDWIVTGYMGELEKNLANLQGNSLERMQQLIMRGADHDGSKDEMIDHLHQPGNSGMHIRLLAKMVTRQAPIYAKLIEEGCREGLFNTAHPLECAEFLFSAVQFLTDMGVYEWSRSDLERRIIAFPELIERQLGAPAGSFKFLHELITTQDDHSQQQG